MPQVWESPALTDSNEIVAAGTLGSLHANWRAIAAKTATWLSRITSPRPNYLTSTYHMFNRGAQHAAPLRCFQPIAALFVRPVLVVDQLVNGILPAAGPPALFTGVVRNRNLHFAHVIRVIRFEQRVTQSSGGIEEPTGTLAARHIRGVHFDADDIIARRDDSLPIRSIQHERLTADPPHIGIAVIPADSLVSS